MKQAPCGIKEIESASCASGCRGNLSSWLKSKAEYYGCMSMRVAVVYQAHNFASHAAEGQQSHKTFWMLCIMITIAAVCGARGQDTICPAPKLEQ